MTDELRSLLREHGALDGLARELGQFGQIQAEQRGPDDDVRPSIAPLVILGIVAVFFLWAFAWPASATESPLNVQFLYESCKAPERSPLNTLCLGYISGVGAMMHIVGTGVRQYPNASNLAMLGICGDATPGAMVQAFENWAKNHPNKWTEDRLLGVVEALGEIWPCKAN